MAKRKVTYPGTVDGQPSQREYVPCAHDGCRECATIRIQTITGWAKLCNTHYDFYWTQVARGAIKELTPSAPNYRERWYREHKQPYAAPRAVNCPPFRLVGTGLDKLIQQEEET